MTRRAGALATVAAAFALAAGAAAAAPATSFYSPPPNPDAQQQIATLNAAGDKADASRVAALAATPHAVWITGGTPDDARVATLKTVNRAAGKNEVPVLALYNIPGRDCSGYSAGGATDLASYEAWIDGVAAGLHGQPAMIVLEPDSLGLLPQANCGSTTFTDADRYAELNYGVDTLSAAGARVYLDATHSGWMAVGDIAARLVQAGVQRAAGFFLNVSNYQYATNEVYYGTWISKCIASGSYAGCPNQYWNGGPPDWNGTALTPYKVWTAGNPDLAANISGIEARYAGMPTGPHFVVDTSRSGRGPWDWAAAGYANAGIAQDWCNPPGRGAGPAPVANPAPLVDAYLWVKVPGESDGSCTRGLPAGSADPEWNVVDPAAGAWFPQQALQLAQLASPPLP